jgi:hypothetical protein
VYQRKGQRSEDIANRTTRRRPQEIEAMSIRIRFIKGVAIKPQALLQIASLGRADERTRTADLVSLRVIGHRLLDVALSCKSRIDKGFSVPCLAHYCGVLRPG